MHVIPANAEIQIQTGCRIESGMTELWYLIAGLIKGFPWGNNRRL